MLSFDITSTQRSSTFDNDHRSKHSYKEKIEKFGNVVDWLPGRHYEVDQLAKFRLIGDNEMDKIMNADGDDHGEEGRKIMSDGQRPEKYTTRFSNTIASCREIYEKSKDAKDDENGTNNTIALDYKHSLSTQERLMCDFYEHYHDSVPEWVDWDQIQRGIDLFITYSPAASQGLYYFALVPGFSIPKIAKVLEQTRYLCPPSTADQVIVRLKDTGGFIANVMLPDGTGRSAGSLRPGGKGWTLALQVRTLHAKVRRSILRRNRKAQEGGRSTWDVEEYGIPINQEDLAATLLAFSVNVLTTIEFILGQPLPVNEQLDYLALWRYIGWLLGVDSPEGISKQCKTQYLDPCGRRMDDSLNECPLIHSRACLESIIIHLMHPNESSVKISHHLLNIGGHQTHVSEKKKKSSRKKDQSHISFGFLYRAYMCRRFIGDPLADALKFPSRDGSFRSLFANVLGFLILLFLRVYTLLTIKSTIFRKRAYRRHLKLMESFDRSWTERHGQRMQKAASDAMGGNTREISDNSSQSAPCPFGLVMPALDTDDGLNTCPHYKED